MPLLIKIIKYFKLVIILTMKKHLLLFAAIILSTSYSIAGGIVTNTNQSAAWARILVRDATTEIDAVYFNPAGLTKLGNGFHLSLSSQSIFQTQTIVNTYPFMNEDTFTGDVKAPVFPSVYAAYKTGRWAFSLGVNPIGGGGGAEFAKGLPIIEMPVSSLVPAFAGQGVTGYSMDGYFSGRSVYWGIQGGVTFAITDNLSVYGGARYVMAKNSYTGHLKDIELTMSDGSSQRADEFMGGLANQASAGSTLASGAATQMQPLIDQGAGSLTLQEAVDAGALTPQQKGLIEGGLKLFGLEQDAIDAMNIAMVQGTFSTIGEQLATQSQELQGVAFLMGDQEADIEQTGSGITPIIGANLALFEDQLNIGVKYEFKTSLELTNKVEPGKGFIIGLNPDGTPVEMFPDGVVTNADMPALLSIGVDWRVIEPLKLSAGYHVFFEKQTGWENADQLDKNSTEIALGAEFNITKSFLLSAGWMSTNPGTTETFNSDLSFNVPSNTFGFGGAINFSKVITLNAGAYFVSYKNAEYNLNYDMGGNPPTLVPYTVNYDKSTWSVALGLDFHFGGNKE